ncbi:MAG: hypothetical protein GAK34_02009 [Delftia tsuruhatensis]|nr:MAG: hypothetical protein GAK34_02009 [Delftia tsuruhatensis]
MGQGRDGRAADDGCQLFLLRIAAGRDQGLAHDQGAQQRLGHQAAAQAFEDHADVEALAAEAASVLGEQRADGADVRELPVQQRAVAFLAIGDVVARLDGVLLGDEAVEAVRQHAAVFGVFEVHVPFSLPDQRPRIILEMMFFWISLEPPKIDSLR